MNTTTWNWRATALAENGTLSTWTIQAPTLGDAVEAAWDALISDETLVGILRLDVVR